MGAKSEKRNGSNPTFPTYPSQFGGESRKGRDWDLALNEVTGAVLFVGVTEEKWRGFVRKVFIVSNQIS